MGLLVTVAAVAVAPDALGDEIGTAADVAAVRAASTAYRDAVARGDAAAVKAAWTAEGDVVDGWGNVISAADVSPAETGPEAARPKLLPAETRLRFVTRDVAIEDGSGDVVLPGMGTAVEGWFAAVWVRRGDGWKLAGLRESERPVSIDAAMIADLDWMVGDWDLVVDGSGKQEAAATTEMKVRWDAGHAFLIREVRMAGGMEDAVEVHQRIGWDPLVKRIRSWSFSSDGSRAEATWSRDGSSWVATQTVVSPAGRQATTVGIYTYDGQDRCVWRTLPEGIAPDEGSAVRATWVRRPRSDVR